jgi:hypothetical protein
MTLRSLLVAWMVALVSGCSAPGDGSDEQGAAGSPSEDSEWTDTLTKNLDEELSVEMEKTSDPSALKALLCRKADVTEKVFSLRSFDGRLCEDKYVSGLKLVGGAALLACWEEDLEDFRDSGCADRALEAYGMSKSSYDPSGVVSQMEAQASAFVKKVEAAGAGSLPYYATARTVFCKIPASLLGPGVSVHNIWCAK